MDPIRHMAVAADVLKERKRHDIRGTMADPIGTINASVGSIHRHGQSSALQYDYLIRHMAYCAEMAEGLVEFVKPGAVRELRGEPVERDDHGERQDMHEYDDQDMR